MSGERKGAVADDLLTSALLEILGQEDRETSITSLVSVKDPVRSDVSLSATELMAVNKGRVHAASDPSYADSSLSNLFYGDSSMGHQDIRCRSCGALCPRNNKYCGYCAAYLGDYVVEHQFEEIPMEEVKLRVALVAINEDRSDGAVIPLNYSETILGRSGDSRFPTDGYLSPRHARLIIENNSLWLEDLDSLNGSFVRTRGEIRLSPGDCFVAGRQVLRFERFEQVVSAKARASDGTRYMGSPPSGGDFKLVQVGIGNITQNVYCISETGAVFGREKGDILFPKDRFMSGRHAQIYPREDGNYYLLDLNSSNGTWLKIARKTRLVHGDLIFLGQQLFRVESPDLV